MIELDTAITAALDGNAILFVGAGFSRGATNVRRESFKTGPELSRHMATRAGVQPDIGLEDAAEQFLETLGIDAFVSELRSEFTAHDVAEHHTTIARIPWRRVYTTNFDDVLELASKDRPPQPVTLSDPVALVGGNTFLCVHINGFVGRLSRETAAHEVKLTEGSQLAATFAASPWSVVFRQDLAVAKAVFFVGYSLGDLDIKRILFESPSLKGKTHFFIGAEPASATVRRAERFGESHRADAQELARAVETTSRTHVPAEPHIVVGKALSKRTIPKTGSTTTDADVLDLLLNGQYRADITWGSLHGGKKYVLDREEVGHILDRFRTDSQVVAIHSNLGNGKSIAAELVALRALEEGYEVYWARRHADNILNECNQVVQYEPRPLFVFEDYHEFMEAIQYVLQRGGSKVRVLLTARSSIHDVLIDRLAALVSSVAVVEYSVDRLSAPEIEWIATWMEEYGLWGSSANLPFARKTGLIKNRCQGQLQGVLVEILKSPQMAKRFESLLERIDNRKSFYEVVLTALVMTVLGYPPSPNELADICGEQVFDVQFRRDPTILQLLDFDHEFLRLRSSVSSQFILQQVADPGSIVEVLTRIATAASRAAPAVPRYQELLRVLMRFSQVQLVMPVSQRREALLKYYESIKNIPTARAEPLFWLQYAIACLTLEELERAGRYFDTAYSLAAGRNYDTFQIDNHYARYLLVRAAKTRERAKVMDALRAARKIIERQIRNERVHYPYRAAANYAAAFEAVEQHLTKEELAEFRDAANTVLDRIEHLPPFRAQHWAVVDCRKAMTSIVASAIKRAMMA